MNADVNEASGNMVAFDLRWKVGPEKSVNMLFEHFSRLIMYET